MHIPSITRVRLSGRVLTSGTSVSTKAYAFRSTVWFVPTRTTIFTCHMLIFTSAHGYYITVIIKSKELMVMHNLVSNHNYITNLVTTQLNTFTDWYHTNIAFRIFWPLEFCGHTIDITPHWPGFIQA